jgi:cobalamin synthase
MLKFKKEKSYQTKAKIVYILPVIFGIFLIVYAIIFASAISYLLMTGVTNSLGGVEGDRIYAC